MNLAQQCPGFIQATDSQSNARLLSEAAVAKGIIADVVVDVDRALNEHRHLVNLATRAACRSSARATI